MFYCWAMYWHNLIKSYLLSCGKPLIGYYTDSNVHPYNLNEEWDSDDGELLPRPSFAVYGRMAEKTESVAFRKKFYDWSDPVDLKVKTVEAKVHAQVLFIIIR